MTRKRITGVALAAAVGALVCFSLGPEALSALFAAAMVLAGFAERVGRAL